MTTNDPEGPERTINVIGHVQRAIESSSETISLGLLSGGSVKTGSFEIYSPYGQNVNVDKVAVSDSAAQLVAERQNQPRVKINYSIKMPTTAEVYTCRATIEARAAGEKILLPVDLIAVRQLAATGNAVR